MIIFFQFFDMVLEKISRVGLIICLLLVLFLSVTTILLRWFGSSLTWIDPLVRHLVFLSAFLGGSLATSSHQHIRIDLFTKIVERSSFGLIQWVHKNLLSFFCFITTLVLFKAAWDFYLIEKEFGSSSFLDIHSSLLVLIIPFGVGLINLRFFNQLILGLLYRGAK